MGCAVLKATVVCPATEKHVKKYQVQESFLVEETGEDYLSITLPYIQEKSFSLQVSWLAVSLIAFIQGVSRLSLKLSGHWEISLYYVLY